MMPLCMCLLRVAVRQELKENEKKSVTAQCNVVMSPCPGYYIRINPYVMFQSNLTDLAVLSLKNVLNLIRLWKSL